MNKKKIVIFATTLAIFISGTNIKICRDRSKDFVEYLNAYTEDIVDDNFYISAHRGFSSLAVENTKEAISLAASKGYVDYIEFDARMTRDNRLVLSHNNALLSSNGDIVDVSSLTYEEVINSTFTYSPSLLNGYWFGNEEQSMMSERMKNLRCADYNLVGLRDAIYCSGNKTILIDLKFNHNIEVLSDELCKELEGIDTSNIIIQSLNIDGIKYVQDNSCLNCLALISNSKDLGRAGEFQRIGLKYNLVSYELVSYLLGEGKTVAIWTVNSTEILDNLIERLGEHYKDVIYITDYPDLITMRLHEYEESIKLTK